MLSAKIILKLKNLRAKFRNLESQRLRLLHVDPNHTKSNQPIPDECTNTRTINDSAHIHVIEKILSSPVHLVHTPSMIPAPQIFTYRTASDPRLPSHDSSSEIVTPKLNHTPRNNPPNTVPNVPTDLDSDSTLSYSSSLDPYDSSDNKYYKRRRRAKNNNNKRQSKTSFNNPIKKCANVTAKLITPT